MRTLEGFPCTVTVNSVSGLSILRPVLIQCDAIEHVVDLIFGRWRGQILHAGAALDVFGHLDPDKHRAAADVASEIGTDTAMLYRLLRALATIGLLAENDAYAPIEITEGIDLRIWGVVTNVIHPL